MDDPRCDKCGAEITTGFMAFFCARGSSCEFWPKDDAGQLFAYQHWEKFIKERLAEADKVMGER